MDAQLDHACSHVVGGVLYVKDSCPRCLGAETYKDFNYDAVGQVLTVLGANKLKQEILKTLATSETPFHPEYGSKLKTRIGKAFDPEVAKAIVKADLTQAIHSFMAIQAGAGALIAAERVRTVLSVRTWVAENEPRHIYGSVVVENDASLPVTLNTTVNV